MHGFLRLPPPGPHRYSTPPSRGAVDLQPLQIDRSSERDSARRSRAGGSAGRWIGRIVVLALALAGVWLFRRPLLERLDRLRLPEVRVIQVSAASSLAAGAVQ